MMTSRRLAAFAPAFLLATIVALWSFAAGAAPRLDRVTLTQGGVAYYEFEAMAGADGVVHLNAPRDQLDDVLKSLVLLDDKARIASVELAGEAPIDLALGGLAFEEDDFDSLGDLLSALKGEEVTLTADRAVEGRILTVDPIDDEVADPAVTLRGASGLLRIPVADIRAIEVADPDLDRALDQAMASFRNARGEGMRRLAIRINGAVGRTVRLAYVAASPVWKTAYRLSLDGKTGALQGWAVFENFSGHDWADVKLTLSSGNPVTYRQALYGAYFPDRPELPVALFDQLTPPADEGVMAEQAFARSEALAVTSTKRMADGAEDMAGGLAPGVSVEAHETATQITLDLGEVSLGAGQTLTLPIIAGDLPVRAVTWLAMGDTRPYAAFEIENGGKTTLPPGIVTVFDRSANGIAYMGDARLGVIPAGAARLLAYAGELKTKAQRAATTSTRVSRASVADGVLSVVETVYHTQSVDLSLPKGEARDFVVDFSAPDRWTLDRPDDARKVRFGYRVSKSLEAGDKGLVEARFREERGRRFALLDTDATILTRYVSGGGLSDGMERALKSVVALKQDAVAAARSLEQASRDLDRARTYENRARENLKAVGDDPVRQQYLDKLVAAEAEVNEADAEAAKAEERLRTAEAELRAFVRNLNIDG